MSAISTSIALEDRVSATLNRIQTTLYNTTAAFNAVDTASNRCLDTFQVEAVTSEMMAYERQITDVRTELTQANAQIERMQRETDEASNKASKLNNSFGGVFGTVTNLLGAYAGFQGVQQIIALSDTMGQADAKLGMMTDDMAEQEAMQERIFEAAQRSRGSYMAMADNVAKLGQRAGDAFKSNDEVLAFAENLNKMFVIAGASQAEMNSASLQLTQALGSGVLRGEELNAVFESAPNVIQAIAKYMNVPIGQIRTMASEGQITSEIVKNAMLSATDEINAQFESMPMTWGQIWTGFTNELLKLSQPILNFISMVAQHWDILKPLFIGMIAILGVLSVAWSVNKVQMMMNAIALSAQTAGTFAYTAAAIGAAFAQGGLNAAIAACPITWIIIGIIALIAIIYAVITAVLKMTDSTHTAFGIIVGTVATAGALIFNIFVGLLQGLLQLLYTLFVYPFIGIIEFVLNAANGGFNSFGDGVANLIGQIIGWFLSLGTVVTKIIDAIFGTDRTSGLNALHDNVVSWGKNEEAITLNKNFDGVQRIEYGEAFNAGVGWGDGVSNDLAGKFKGASGADALADVTTMNEIAANTGNTAANVDKLSKSVDISNEQLQYMRDLAEQEVINRYTTAEIKVDMTNNNNISKDVDIDDFIGKVANGVNEAMTISAEGVHA